MAAPVPLRPVGTAALGPASLLRAPWMGVADGAPDSLDRPGVDDRAARIVDQTRDLRRRLGTDAAGWSALQPLVAAAIGITERQLLQAHLHHPSPPCPDSHNLQVRPLPLDAEGLQAALCSLWPLHTQAQGRHGRLSWRAAEPPSVAQLRRAGAPAPGSAPRAAATTPTSTASTASTASCAHDAPSSDAAGATVWAVEARSPDGPVQRSLQLLDAQGRGTLQWRLEGSRAPIAWLDLLDAASAAAPPGAHAAPPRKAPPSLSLSPCPSPSTTTPPADPTHPVDALQQGWRALRHPEHWAPLCAALGLSLAQALRLAPEGYARPLGADAAVELLALAAQAGQACRLRLGPELPACEAPPREVRLRDGWLQASGDDFELRLRLSAIDGCWLLNRPGRDGLHQSLLLLDREGRPLAEIGAPAAGPAPARPACAWRLLLQGLLSTAQAA